MNIYLLKNTPYPIDSGKENDIIETFRLESGKNLNTSAFGLARPERR
jgi:hypothetical protein